VVGIGIAVSVAVEEVHCGAAVGTAGGGVGRPDVDFLGGEAEGEGEACGVEEDGGEGGFQSGGLGF